MHCTSRASGKLPNAPTYPSLGNGIGKYENFSYIPMGAKCLKCLKPPRRGVFLRSPTRTKCQKCQKCQKVRSGLFSKAVIRITDTSTGPACPPQCPLQSLSCRGIGRDTVGGLVQVVGLGGLRLAIGLLLPSSTALRYLADR